MTGGMQLLILLAAAAIVAAVWVVARHRFMKVPRFSFVAAPLVLVFALAGCGMPAQKPLATVNSSLTHGNIKNHLVIGKTTSNEVIEVFGAPNITTQTGEGNESWVYQRAASAQQGELRNDFLTLLLFGRSTLQTSAERTARMITLVIEFDKAGVVSDFRSRASAF